MKTELPDLPFDPESVWKIQAKLREEERGNNTDPSSDDSEELIKQKTVWADETQSLLPIEDSMRIFKCFFGSKRS